MKLISVSLLTFCGIGSLLVAQEDAGKKLTARELFYAAVDAPVPTRSQSCKAGRETATSTGSGAGIGASGVYPRGGGGI